MKRSWIGFGILLALLAAGIFATMAMTETHAPVADCLEAAAGRAMAEDWEVAGRLARQAWEQWDRQRWLRDFLSDKTPVEEIEAQLAGLAPLLDGRQAEEFAQTCAELAVKVRAVGEAHRAQWGNIV